ncbi:hypothetical protein GEV33_001472 [Tenebrio molitor]|uniref:Gustatory receptor n=1 Tax=Tenebrio molitor TaxID=7067 RepID=A0A8J6LG21_TENMO|nr:hypothetical protein GEV33_001472 [Tenebrio molitor]
MIMLFLFCHIPASISCINHVFLNKVLSTIRNQFEVIDQHLQKQIDRVDLYEIFPLTKVEKIRQLKESERSFNICRIEDLSLLHYDLVNLAVEVNKLFDVTTMVAMGMWFGFVIDGTYSIIFLVVNNIEMDPFLVLYMLTSLLFFLAWFFFMVRMYSLTQQTKQINCVDLYTIFPFTKVEKIRELKEAEKSFNIYRMEELSLLHYDLVNLAVAVSRLFDVTTMVAMVVWFVWVIDTFYMLVIFAVNQIQMERPFINLLITTSSLFFLVWFFLIVRMYSRTQQTANKMATSVHEIWNFYNSREEVDKQVCHLQLISVRLLNTKLQFTARHFFNLDWTFCHTDLSSGGWYRRGRWAMPPQNKLVYGILQFPSKMPTDTLSKIIARLWCIPLYTFHFYTFLMWLTNAVSSPYLNEVRENVDFMASLLCMLVIGINIVVSHRRSNSLHLILLKIKEIKSLLTAATSKNPSQSSDWLELILLLSCSLNIILAFSFDMGIYVLFFYIPSSISCLNHVFLNRVLTTIRNQFQVIDQHLQKQINCVDLNTIFPLTKVEKIRQLKEAEKTFNICRIEELSLLHFDLVNLAIEVSKLFDVTTLVAMVTWFGMVIDTIYTIIFCVMNGIQMDPPSLFWYTLTTLLFFLLWFFFMVRMYSRTQQTANKMSTYVHEIWNFYNSKSEVDTRVLHLQLISVRLLNIKLQFTARNFFHLDWTFCHTMIAAVTTYVVILIQFHI